MLPSEAAAYKLFANTLGQYERAVSKLSGLSQNQFDALVSFHYNTGAIFRSTLLKLHKAGKHDLAAQEFGRWVSAGGKRMNGLVRRRKAERDLYVQP